MFFLLWVRYLLLPQAFGCVKIQLAEVIWTISAWILYAGVKAEHLPVTVLRETPTSNDNHTTTFDPNQTWTEIGKGMER